MADTALHQVIPIVATQAVSCGSVAIHEWSHEYTNWDPQQPGAIRVFVLIRGWRRQAEQLLPIYQNDIGG
ncbi:MAG: hypothetical protein Kow0063_40790 [Anaerolineae bacterium]